MSKYLYLLLAGHRGGFTFNGKTHQMTAGKRSPKFADGSRVLEGVFNREICQRVHEVSHLDTAVVNPGLADISQRERVNLVNEIHAKTGKRCIVLFNHANAMGNGRDWNDAHGFRVFHGYNASKRSRWMAQRLHEMMEIRTSLTPRQLEDKSRWIVLTQTQPPAVFLEDAFMTNLKDAKYLASEEGKSDITLAICHTLIDFENHWK